MSKKKTINLRIGNKRPQIIDESDQLDIIAAFHGRKPTDMVRWLITKEFKLVMKETR